MVVDNLLKYYCNICKRLGKGLETVILKKFHKFKTQHLLWNETSTWLLAHNGRHTISVLKNYKKSALWPDWWTECKPLVPFGDAGRGLMKLV